MPQELDLEAIERANFEAWWPSVGQEIGKVAAWLAWKSRAFRAPVTASPVAQAQPAALQVRPTPTDAEIAQMAKWMVDDGIAIDRSMDAKHVLKKDLPPFDFTPLSERILQSIPVEYPSVQETLARRLWHFCNMHPKFGLPPWEEAFQDTRDLYLEEAAQFISLASLPLQPQAPADPMALMAEFNPSLPDNDRDAWNLTTRELADRYFDKFRTWYLSRPAQPTADPMLRVYLELDSFMRPHNARLRAAMLNWVKTRTPNELIALIESGAAQPPAAGTQGARDAFYAGYCAAVNTKYEDTPRNGWLDAWEKYRVKV